MVPVMSLHCTAQHQTTNWHYKVSVQCSQTLQVQCCAYADMNVTKQQYSQPIGHFIGVLASCQATTDSSTVSVSLRLNLFIP